MKLDPSPAKKELFSILSWLPIFFCKVHYFDSFNRNGAADSLLSTTTLHHSLLEYIKRTSYELSTERTYFIIDQKCLHTMLQKLVDRNLVDLYNVDVNVVTGYFKGYYFNANRFV